MIRAGASDADLVDAIGGHDGDRARVTVHDHVDEAMGLVVERHAEVRR